MISPLPLAHFVAPKLVKLTIINAEGWQSGFRGECEEKESKELELFPRFIHLPSVMSLSVHTFGSDAALLEAFRSFPEVSEIYATVK